MMSPPEAATRLRAPDTAGFVTQTAARNTTPRVRAFGLIVFICPLAADKISGGRSPNDQAFESFGEVAGEPHGSRLSGESGKEIQTAINARLRGGTAHEVQSEREKCEKTCGQRQPCG
ncbi:hypothetical protein [Paraburkholderia fungorum]|uniref:hypothetical protein n=1 Tax=Paraburkholderia fungorum TaxID=134537 RepID=UPI00115FEDCB|nr:hypothetical protein [Paraburkholderia fungorum]